MTHFLLSFVALMLVVLGMAAGVILTGRRITGSCGGLNAISDADKCLVCKQSIDPDNPLRERISCPRRRHSSAQLQSSDPAVKPLARMDQYALATEKTGMPWPKRRGLRFSQFTDFITRTPGYAIIQISKRCKPSNRGSA